MKDLTNLKINWLRIIYFILVIFLVVFLVTQFPDLDKGLHRLKFSKAPYYLGVFPLYNQSIKRIAIQIDC